MWGYGVRQAFHLVIMMVDMFSYYSPECSRSNQMHQSFEECSDLDNCMCECHEKDREPKIVN